MCILTNPLKLCVEYFYCSLYLKLIACNDTTSDLTHKQQSSHAQTISTAQYY